MSEALFLKATRKKYRFRAHNGHVTIEDVWDTSLEQLNEMAKSYNHQVKELQEESFIAVAPVANEHITDCFELVKAVIKVRLEEEAAKTDEAVKRKRRRELINALASKEQEALTGMTAAEIKAELEKL